VTQGRQSQQQALEALQVLTEALSMRRAVAAAEDGMAREQLAQVGPIIAGLIARQKNVVSATNRLDDERGNVGGTTATQASELKNLAAEERLLADETAQLKPQLAAAEAFSFAMETAASSMQRA